MKSALAAALAFLLCGTLGAQFGAQFDNTNGSSLRGQINMTSPVAGGLLVELYRWGEASPVESTDADLAGNFEFSNVPAGDYRLTLSDYHGHVIAEKIVNVMPPASFVNIDLPDYGGSAPANSSGASGVVSIAELQHKVPGKAAKEFEKAGKAVRKGDEAGAIAHLQKAIEIDPAYTQAYNNLGARYLRAQQFEKAAGEFQKALELDQNFQPAAVNLGLACIALQRFADAEKYARKAISLDATSNRARFVLGIALAAQNREPGEALENLKAAARELPEARLALAQFLSDHGQKAQAAGELRKYLDSSAPDPQERPKLEAWLSQLEAE
jgi:tetratricopeptide (TPR) repeat protein